MLTRRDVAIDQGNREHPGDERLDGGEAKDGPKDFPLVKTEDLTPG
jgi:hypothetical protein